MASLSLSSLMLIHCSNLQCFFAQSLHWPRRCVPAGSSLVPSSWIFRWSWLTSKGGRHKGRVIRKWRHCWELSIACHMGSTSSRRTLRPSLAFERDSLSRAQDDTWMPTWKNFSWRFHIILVSSQWQLDWSRLDRRSDLARVPQIPFRDCVNWRKSSSLPVSSEKKRLIATTYSIVT